MYKTLSSWRGLLVVVIVLYHTPIEVLTEAAHMGVSFFLVMSGALLAMRHPRVECSWWQWMLPRARRIYAVHWLVLALLAVVMCPLGAFKADWTLVANALLVHPFVPVREVYLSYNKPTWFLSALLLCYACYPMLAAGFARISIKAKWVVVCALAVVHCVVMSLVSQEMRDWLFDMPVARLGDFVCGMSLGATLPLVEARCGKWMRSHATLVELTVVTAVVAVIVAVNHMQWLDWCEDVTVWWLPGALLLIMSVALNGNEGLIGRIMRTKPMTWLGTINLEVYMFAALVSYVYSHYLAAIAGHFGHMEFYDISWPITLPLTLLAACMFHCLTKKFSK